MLSSEICSLQDIERGESRFAVGLSSTNSRPASTSASTPTPGTALASAPASPRDSNRYDVGATAGVGHGVNVREAGTRCGQSTRASANAGPTARREGEPACKSRWKAIGCFLGRLTIVMLLLAAAAAALTLVVVYMGPIYLVQLLIVISVAYFVSGGRLRWFYVALRTAPRDIK